MRRIRAAGLAERWRVPVCTVRVKAFYPVGTLSIRAGWRPTHHHPREIKKNVPRSLEPRSPSIITHRASIMNPIQNDVSEAPEGADQAPVDDDMPGDGVDDLHSTSDEDAHARAQDAEGGEHTQTTFQSTTLLAVFKRDITRTEMSTGDLAAAATLAQVAVSKAGLQRRLCEVRRAPSVCVRPPTRGLSRHAGMQGGAWGHVWAGMRGAAQSWARMVDIAGQTPGAWGGWRRRCSYPRRVLCLGSPRVCAMLRVTPLVALRDTDGQRSPLRSLGGGAPLTRSRSRASQQ
jgi:hypothetical protein